MTKEHSRKELERRYEESRRLSFPPAHGGEEISRLHDELILYDADVAAAVMAVLEAPKSDSSLRKLTGLQENDELQRLIDRSITTFPEKTRVGEVAREYKYYYDSIKKMLQAAHSYLDASAE